MPTFNDITGSKFGRLTVISKAKGRKWTCKCSCGSTKDIDGSSLKRGVSTSCGCFRKEHTASRNASHGMSDTAVYHCWKNMKGRCYTPSASYYENYGGRGITVCDRWINSFENFLEDMGFPPSGCSLDRINVDGNYEPSNCRWATDKQQQRNKRNSISIDGFNLMTLAKELNIPYMTLYSRLTRAKEREGEKL